MIEFYDSVNNFETEIIKSRSRFIGRVYHIDNEEHALGIIKALKKEFFDATHICYGYVADLQGTARYSDGGEPAGTAGRPIMDVLTKRELKRVLAVVIRYFGGIKLGAGGLARAYGECAGAAIEGAEKLRYALCAICKVSVEFSLAKRLKNAVLAAGKLLDLQYENNAIFFAALPVGSFEEFEKNVADLSGGRAELQRLSDEYKII